MNYELAKELEDAGFPQSGKGGRIAPPEKIVARREDFVYVPTLEELIEATGTRYMFNEGGGWTATFRTTRGNGPTLDVALAHLWLALKSKRYAGHEAHEGKN